MGKSGLGLPGAGSPGASKSSGRGEGGRRRGFWRVLLAKLDEGEPLLACGDEKRRAREHDIVDALAREASLAGFGAAGMFLAETAKPLSRLGSQILHLFTPSVGLLVGERRLANLACLLEDRSNLERFILAVERQDEQRGWGPSRW